MSERTIADDVLDRVRLTQSMSPPEANFGLTAHSLCIPPFPGKTLMLGWAEGTTAWLYRKIFGDSFVIHGIDLNPPIENYTNLLIESSNTTHMIADAEQFVKNCDQYDIVIVDLYNGDHIPKFVFSDPFILNLSKIVRALLIVNITGRNWDVLKPYDDFFNLDCVKQVQHDKVAFFNPLLKAKPAPLEVVQ